MMALILTQVTRDASQLSESGKTMSFYVLGAFICIDHEKFFLGQLQSRGFLRSCLMRINNSSYQITYGILFSLVIVLIPDALSAGPDKLPLLSCDASFRHEFQENVMIAGNDPTVEGFVDSVRLAWAVHLMTILDGIDPRERVSSASSNDMRNICSCMETIFSNNVFQFLLDKVLQTAAYQNDDEDIIYMYNAYLHKLITCFLSHPLARDKVKETKEKAMTALSPYRVSGSNDFVPDVSMHSQQASEAAPQPFVSLLEFVSEIYQVWPYEESDEYGFVQGLFGMMRALFAREPEPLTLGQSFLSMEKGRRSELNKFRLCFSLNSYLYFLVTKKSIRLQISDGSANYSSPAEQQQPSLSLLSFLLNSVTSALERAAEEKYLLLNKIQDINELSRQEVDEIISVCGSGDCVSSSDNIQKRRYTALVQMCQIVGYKDQLITLLLLLAENVLNIILVHFQDSSYTHDSSQDRRTITYGTEPDSREDLNTYCAKLTPILERLEGLSEDKTGHQLKVFHRLVNSLKEMTFQKLVL